MQTRHVQFGIRINPDTAPGLVAKVPDALRQIVSAKDRLAFERAHVKTLDQNFIEFEIAYNMLTAEFVVFLDTQQKIILEVMQMFSDMGISTSTATQQVIVQKADARQDGPEQLPLPAAIHSVYKGR
jgi:hypothetical protein